MDKKQFIKCAANFYRDFITKNHVDESYTGLLAGKMPKFKLIISKRNRVLMIVNGGTPESFTLDVNKFFGSRLSTALVLSVIVRNKVGCRYPGELDLFSKKVFSSDLKPKRIQSYLIESARAYTDTYFQACNRYGLMTLVRMAPKSCADTFMSLETLVNRPWEITGYVEAVETTPSHPSDAINFNVKLTDGCLLDASGFKLKLDDLKGTDNSARRYLQRKVDELTNTTALSANVSERTSDMDWLVG